MATMVLAPTPTKLPKAAQISIKGLATVNPASAKGPHPCPIKILSARLYNELTIIAIIPGKEYFKRSFRMESFSNSIALNDAIHYNFFAISSK